MLSPYVMRQSLPQRRASTNLIVLELGPTARVTVALLLMVALQTTLVRLPYFGFVFEHVDFILILTVFVGVQPRALRAALVGMTGGLLQDLVWGVLYGASGFTKMLIGYALAVVSVKFSLDSKVTRLLVLPLCSVVNTGLFAFFCTFFRCCRRERRFGMSSGWECSPCWGMVWPGWPCFPWVIAGWVSGLRSAAPMNPWHRVPFDTGTACLLTPAPRAF